MYAENCHRCHKPANGVTTMSMFNTQIICIPCKDEEKENPRYAEAVRIEREEVLKGNRNFEGIGL
jgi:hypothetical protein